MNGKWIEYKDFIKCVDAVFAKLRSREDVSPKSVQSSSESSPDICVICGKTLEEHKGD